MSDYDESIGKVAEYLESMRRNGRQVRETACPASVDELREGLPVQVGPGANPGIILRSDTFAELGNPAEGSTGLILWTENPSFVSNGRITLIGPDVPECEGGSVPFGQVLILAGTNLNAEHQEKIEEFQHISDHLEGYMVRSASRNIWGRVSNDAAAKGFTLETLGKALMITMKANVPEVESMEVIFVTSDRGDIRELDEIAVEAGDIRKEIIKDFWKARGYDLECDLDCTSCGSKTTCDDVRDMLRARHEKETAETADS